jgi:hypothetical protein
MSLRRFNPFASNASIKTHRDFARSSRPPTYMSDTTVAAPPYSPNESITSSAHDRSQRVSAWSASLPGGSSVAYPDSDTMYDQAAELMDTLSIGESTVMEITNPGGPRYSELQFYTYHTSLKDQIISVYYRIYAEDGAIPSKNRVCSDDPFLGRIQAKLVTPPHTAINLKRCLSNAENIDSNITTSLFISPSSRIPIADSARVSILAHPGPGYTPTEPMALVGMFSATGNSPSEVAEPQAEGDILFPEDTTSSEIQYSKGYGPTIAHCTDQLF